MRFGRDVGQQGAEEYEKMSLSCRVGPADVLQSACGGPSEGAVSLILFPEDDVLRSRVFRIYRNEAVDEMGAEAFCPSLIGQIA